MLSTKAVYGIAGSVSTTVSLGGGGAAVLGFRRNSPKPVRHTNQVHRLVDQGNFEFLMCADAVVDKYAISFEGKNFKYKHDNSSTAETETDLNNAKTFFTNKMQETCKSYGSNISDQELTTTIHNLFDSHKTDQEFGGKGGKLPTTKQQRAINEYGDALICLKKAANSFFVISNTHFTHKGVKHEISKFNSIFTQVAASCSSEKNKTTKLLDLYTTTNSSTTEPAKWIYDLISYLTAELPQDGTKLQKVKVIDGTPSASGQCDDFSTHIATTLGKASQTSEDSVKIETTTYTKQQKQDFISALTTKLQAYTNCTMKSTDDKKQIDEISNSTFNTLLRNHKLTDIYSKTRE